MLISCWLKFYFYFCLFYISFSSFFSAKSHKNESLPILCHPEESLALIDFRNSFTNSYNNPMIMGTWKKGSDCCGWEGITCDPISHHVVGLDLSCSGLTGPIHSNHTLFSLHHLRTLILSGNDFSSSQISPNFGNFPHLTHLDLRHTNFSGQVPLELSQLSKLHTLDLSANYHLKMPNSNTILANMTRLTTLRLSWVNLDSQLPPSLINMSSLTTLYLDGCNLRGELFPEFLNLPFLQDLDVGQNSGLYFKFPLSNWSSSLEHLRLSHVNLSTKLPSSLTPQAQQLSAIILSNCSLHGPIPSWVWNLSYVDLSDNQLTGNLPSSISIIKPLKQGGNETLQYLDLSHNQLNGSFTSFPWRTLHYLDLSFNMFEGLLPMPSITIQFFSASNNRFLGPLDSSICGLTSLSILDLSTNTIKSEFPHCLTNTSNSLTVLNLGSNNIYGVLPTTFPKCSSLQYLDLSNNQLEGLVPKSWANCKNLRVLNLQRNKLRGEFPFSLGTLPHIQALTLSSNELHGPITHSKIRNPFSTLRILDLSYNNFSEKITSSFIKSLKAMMETDEFYGDPQYMEGESYESYYYSITLTINDVTEKYEKIITSLAIINLSSNKFEGEIPNNIGRLVSIRHLNLSHNLLTGHIPPSISKLTLLVSLDLSFNKLTGQISHELVSLTSLRVFNVSENQLVGPIPQGNNFDTFLEDSYKGNLGLCGSPILPECGGGSMPRQQSSMEGQDDHNYVEVGMMMVEWKVIMMGCGCGAIVGLAWGYYMLSVGKPFCPVKLVHFIELAVVDFYVKQFGRRRR